MTHELNQVTIDGDHRDPAIEERYHVRPGDIYKAQAGYQTFEGALRRAELHVCVQGFIPLELVLEECIMTDLRTGWKETTREASFREGEIDSLRRIGPPRPAELSDKIRKRLSPKTEETG